MRPREILDGKTAGVEERQRKRIAERECGGRARGRREPQRTGFGIDARIEMHVGRLRQRRLLVAGQRDHLCTLSLEMGQQRNQFVGLAGIRQQQYDVVAGDHPEVTVIRFGGMHEKRGRAGGRERRGEFARDVAGLADTGDDHATATAEQHSRGREKGAAEALLEREYRGSLRREHVASKRERALRIDTGRGRDGLCGL